MGFGSCGVARPLPCRGSAAFPQVKTSGYFLVIRQRPANLQTCPKFAARFVMRRCGARDAFARCGESDAFARCKERGALARCREGDAFGGRGEAACLRGVRNECDAGHSRHVFWKYEAPTQLLRARAHAGGVYSRLKGLRRCRALRGWPWAACGTVARCGSWVGCEAVARGRLWAACGDSWPRPLAGRQPRREGTRRMRDGAEATRHHLGGR